VGVLCSFAENEDGEELFKLDLVFPEIPNTRRIKLYWNYAGRIVIAMSENPGINMIDSFIGSLSSNASMNPTLVDFVRRQMSREFLSTQILHCMEPVLYATSCDGEGASAPAGTDKAVVKRQVARGNLIRKKEEN
jgi:hypothetical protein